MKFFAFVIFLLINYTLYAQETKNSELLGTLTFKNGTDIVLVGDYAYVSNSSGIIIISVSDFSSPNEVGFIETPGNCTSLYFNKYYLFAADGKKGIRIYDITDPEHPDLKSNIIMDTLFVYDLEVVNNYLVLVSTGGQFPNDETNFKIIDISDIENPIKISQVNNPTGYKFFKICANDSLIAVADLYTTRLYDWTEPSKPVELSEIDYGSAIMHLYLKGNYLYVAASGYGFSILDLTNPSLPEETGKYSFGIEYNMFPVGVYIENDIAYILVQNGGLRILDISDKWNPIQIGQNLKVKISSFYDYPDDRAIFVRNYNAFIVDKINGLYIASYGYEPQSVNKENQMDLNDFNLLQNYPNPFNPTTQISYQIPNGNVQNVILKVYDILGKEVATLVNKKQNPGKYQVEFDGSYLPNGVYFYRLEAGKLIETKKMVLLR